MKIKLGIFLLLFCFSALYGDTIVDRYIENAEKQMIINNHEKAYSYINFVLKYYAPTETPVEVQVLAEKIYFAYIGEILEADKLDMIDELDLNTTQYPAAASTRVMKLVQQLIARKVLAGEEERRRIEDEQRRIDEEQRRAEEAERRRIEEEQRRIAEEQRKAEEAERRIEEAKQRAAEQVRIEAEAEARRLELQESERKFQEEMNRIIEQQKALEAEKAQLQREERAEYDKKEEALRKERDAMVERQQEDLTRILTAQQKLELERQELERQERTEYLKQEAALKQERDLLLVKQQQDLNRILETTIAQKNSDAETTTRISQNIIFLIAVIGIFLFMGFGLLIFLSIRNSNKQQQSFENTISYLRVAKESGPSQNITLSLPGVAPEVDIDSSRMIADTSRPALPAASEVDPERLKVILEKCYAYGKEIDKITYRKNGSKNTAELVFKISEQMGYSKSECMIFFAAGFIHDIGFLKIDPEIFHSEHINEDQFSQLKTHTVLGIKLIGFIDHDLQHIFIDAISKHHENLDGSGYPAGLKEDQIPYIARVIRVVESYISCISRREYKEIQDQQSAIEELFQNTDKYDEKIISELETII